MTTYEQNEYMVQTGMDDDCPHLAHYGVRGQKHGERRYQNEDGSLTPEGREHYGIQSVREKFKDAKETYKSERDSAIKKRNQTAKNVSNAIQKAENLERKSDAAYKNAKDMYKGLGKNFISRVKAVSKAQKGQGTKEANAYLKEMDRSDKLSDKAYNIKLKASKQYKTLGSTSIGRKHVMKKNDKAAQLWDEFEHRPTQKKVDEIWDAEKRRKKQYKEMERMGRYGA